MANAGDIRPQQAADVNEFAAAMRQLKESSGLTYRQLEERAAEQGEVLARSTVADVLGGKATPRPELVAAFVRACGDEQRVHEWLAARERAVGAGSGRNDGDDEGEAGDEQRTPGRRILRWLSRHRVPALLLGLSVVSGVAATVWAVRPSVGDGSAGPGPSGSRTVLPHGPVEIRPVLADGLCLTDGHAEGYDSLVAVQRPCGDVAPQETELVPAGEDTIRVQWYHPDHGKGCLKAISVRTGAALLEPWDDCGKTSRFRVERSGPGGGHQYVLRVVGGGCVGISGSGSSAGAPAVTQPCDGSRSQTFSITPAR